MTTYRASPLYLGYVTFAPKNSPVTISVGQFGSLEGYESGVSWNNANLFKSALFYVENGNRRRRFGNLYAGQVLGAVIYGDGYDTRVFNFLQALATYQFNSNNALSVFYGGELGKTGNNAITYDSIRLASTALFRQLADVGRVLFLHERQSERRS